MDEETKNILEETRRLAEENNNILRYLRRTERIALFIKIARWIIILGIAVGAFYFLQPYVEILNKTVKDTGDTVNQIKSFIPKR